ncbi:MAG: transketolase [Pseudomonadota bacterium]
MASKNNGATAAARRELANAIRALSMDAVQAANSGHPGAPMGMADIAEVLWRDFLKHSPGNPEWWDRDRFVLSNGHGSMLLYSLLHLSGYPLSLQQLRDFRQLGAHTAGHPERDLHIGIETTTGPLGQGITNAVGMAIAEKHLGARFNRPGFDIVDHHTYAFVGDGCLMEGISHEACSLAGTLQLGKLICFYDDNGISIDGDVSGWFTDDTSKRFEAYGWQVIDGVDGHDPDAIRKAITSAQADASKPTLICCKTVIGFGSPNKQGTAATHGAPLGDDEIAATREALDWRHPPFEIPDHVREAWDARQRGASAESDWNQMFVSYAKKHPEAAAALSRQMEGRLPDQWARIFADAVDACAAASATMATRKASLAALNALVAEHLPEMIGGSADLTGSNCTYHAGSQVLDAGSPAGNYINYGVREFAMSAIGNGLQLHGGVRPYSGTFLTFSDYARNAVRMAALMSCPNIFVYTHDSIGLGEDGPTHQPVEHVASLRLMPNLHVWRPADTMETLFAWRSAIEQAQTPTALVLTRQNLPFLPRDEQQLEGIKRGGYILRDTSGDPDLVLIATGSEVALAVESAEALAREDIATRVVSIPCCEVFSAQSTSWQAQVLGSHGTRRLAIEAGVSDYWWRWVGSAGDAIGMDSFGESAPAEQLFEKYGFSVDNVVTRAKKIMAG